MDKKLHTFVLCKLWSRGEQEQEYGLQGPPTYQEDNSYNDLFSRAHRGLYGDKSELGNWEWKETPCT